MSYTTDLLDQFKTKNGIDSDYAAAKALGLRPNRLSNYRTGVSHADDKTAVILADALGLDRLQTIARVNMDRSRDSKERAFWRHIAAAAAIAVVALLPQGNAHASSGEALTASSTMHYAKYKATLPAAFSRSYETSEAFPRSDPIHLSHTAIDTVPVLFR